MAGGIFEVACYRQVCNKKRKSREAFAVFGALSRPHRCTTGFYILVQRPTTAGILETMVCRILMVNVVFQALQYIGFGLGFFCKAPPWLA